MRGICAHLTVSDFSRHFHYKWRGKETDPLSNSRLSWQLLRFISFRPVTWSSLFYNIVRIHCITQIFCLPFSSGCLQRLHHLLPYSTPPCTNLKKKYLFFFLKKEKLFKTSIHCGCALFAQSAKTDWNTNSTFTPGDFGSMLLNAHDLFFHRSLFSITTSWWNAPVNPRSLAICLCSCSSNAAHTVLLYCTYTV